MEYLYDRWEALKVTLKGKHIFLFLDFDGTLAPIAKTPGNAQLPQDTKMLLTKISGSSKLHLAFISGRSLDDLKAKIGLNNAVYSGNHGLEIQGPKITFRPQVPVNYRKIIEFIKDELLRKTRNIPGVLIEDKGLTLSVHFRLVDKQHISLLKTIFHETVIVYLAKGKVRIKSGKKVLEVWPPSEWDKGKVVLWLLARQRFSSEKENIVPVYIGDDLTDEDAFRALSATGITVFVGRASYHSDAKYYLKNSNEVRRFLKELLEV